MNKKLDKTQEQHWLHEERVFIEFLNGNTFLKEVRSFDKGIPPQPDVICKIEDGEKLGFELVRLDESEFLKDISIGFARRRVLKEMTSSESEFGEILRQKFPNRFLWLSICRGVQLNRFPKVLGAGLRFLACQDESFVKEMIVPIKDLPELERVEITVLEQSPTHFDLYPEAIGIDDSIVKIIAKKAGKTYQSDCPVDLLAYYEIQPSMLEQQTIDEIQTVFSEIDLSRFRRVWLFDRYSKIKHQFKPTLAKGNK
ncbi:MAG: hypothetical protein HQM09_19465 [Candidatus Riflebacteria bacterium]|nr:hypothetical protein [Candidatus Riflebacteria bacterium]